MLASVPSALSMSCRASIFTINLTFQHHYLPVSLEEPQRSHMMWLCSSSTATQVPKMGPSGKKRTHVHLPAPAHPLPSSATVIGGAQQRTGNSLLLTTPATSLEQPESEPRLCQEGQQGKAPMLREGDGGSSHIDWWTVALLGAVPGPPTNSTNVDDPSLHVSFWYPSAHLEPRQSVF